MPCTGVASEGGTFVKIGRPEKKLSGLYYEALLQSKGLQLRKMTIHKSFLSRETLYKMFICITERKTREETNSNNSLAPN